MRSDAYSNDFSVGIFDPVVPDLIDLNALRQRVAMLYHYFQHPLGCVLNRFQDVLKWVTGEGAA
jgi:hypothetical protein